jgi:acetylornithine deacetylase/succinyl-diaminopimelate desuccinylase-like protein
MDIKGPLAFQTYAAASMIGEAPGDVIVAHTVLEERGGLGMKHLLESGGRPAASCLGEATHGDVCIGHRGRAELEIVLEGVAGTRACRSGEQRARPAGPALAAVRDLEPTRSDPVLGPRASSPRWSTCAGDPQRDSGPVVVAIDWRILPGDDDASLIRRRSRRHRGRVPEPPEGLSYEVRMVTELQRTYTGIETDRNLLTPGFLMDPDHPAVLAAAEAVGPARRRGCRRPSVHGSSRRTADGRAACTAFRPWASRPARSATRTRTGSVSTSQEARWGFERYPALIAAVQRALVA